MLRQDEELVSRSYRAVTVASALTLRVWATVLALAVDSNRRVQLL